MRHHLKKSQLLSDDLQRRRDLLKLAHTLPGFSPQGREEPPLKELLLRNRGLSFHTDRSHSPSCHLLQRSDVEKSSEVGQGKEALSLHFADEGDRGPSDRLLIKGICESLEREGSESPATPRRRLSIPGTPLGTPDTLPLDRSDSPFAGTQSPLSSCRTESDDEEFFTKTPATKVPIIKRRANAGCSGWQLEGCSGKVDRGADRPSRKAITPATNCDTPSPNSASRRLVLRAQRKWKEFVLAKSELSPSNIELLDDSGPRLSFLERFYGSGDGRPRRMSFDSTNAELVSPAKRLRIYDCRGEKLPCKSKLPTSLRYSASTSLGVLAGRENGLQRSEQRTLPSVSEDKRSCSISQKRLGGLDNCSSGQLEKPKLVRLDTIHATSRQAKRSRPRSPFPSGFCGDEAVECNDDTDGSPGTEPSNGISLGSVDTYLRNSRDREEVETSDNESEWTLDSECQVTKKSKRIESRSSSDSFIDI